VAKLKAPLFSFSASGKLADALVYFTWKGLNVVRQYVIPSNPDTTLQQTQRGHLGDAVDLIHDALADVDHPLSEVDQTAYAALAAARGKVMTWFNMAVKLYLDTILTTIGDAEVPVVYKDMSFIDKAVAHIQVNLFIEEETGSSLTHGTFYFGTSKTNMINSQAAEVAAGVAVQLLGDDLSAFLTAGKKYYWQFRPDADKPCEGADSGIYSFVAE